VSRRGSHLIITLLVNTDFVIVSMNVYVGALVTSLSVVNITATIPGAESIIISRAPVFTMANTCIRRGYPILRVIRSMSITYSIAGGRSLQMVKNWAIKTPKNFKFTAKFPKVITHDKKLNDVDQELERFFDSMTLLENKTLALLIQLPPSLQIHKGLEHLRELVSQLDTRFH
jgi:Protein of unknown function DUF72